VFALLLFLSLLLLRLALDFFSEYTLFLISFVLSPQAEHRVGQHSLRPCSLPKNQRDQWPKTKSAGESISTTTIFDEWKRISWT